MKITITMTGNETCKAIDLAAEIGASREELIEHVNSKTIIKSKSVNISSYNGTYEMDIDEKLIIKILNKFSPILSVFKSLFYLIRDLFQDITDEIGEPEVIINGENIKTGSDSEQDAE